VLEERYPGRGAELTDVYRAWNLANHDELIRTVEGIPALLSDDACIGKYFKYLSEGNIEKAYNLLSEEYKDYKSLNEYKKLVENNGAYTYEVEKIYKKNNGLYIAELTVNNNETKYLVYIDETTKAFSISPDSLIKYYDKSYSINKWDFSFKIQDYIVETNKNIFNVTIKNKSSKNSLNITNVIVYSNNDSIYGNDDEIILAPKEEKTFQIITDNNIELPNSISIIRNKAEKNEIKKYSLDF
jgi:hypothetical protein